MLKVYIEDEIILNDDYHQAEEVPEYNEKDYYYLGKISGLIRMKQHDYILIDKEKQIFTDKFILVRNKLESDIAEPFSLTFLSDKEISFLLNLLGSEISVFRKEKTFLLSSGKIFLFIKENEEAFPDISFLFEGYSTEAELNAKDLLSLLNQFLIFNDKYPSVVLSIKNDTLVIYKNTTKEMKVKTRGINNQITVSLKYLKEALSYCKKENIILKIKNNVLYIQGGGKDIFIAGIYKKES